MRITNTFCSLQFKNKNGLYRVVVNRLKKNGSVIPGVPGVQAERHNTADGRNGKELDHGLRLVVHFLLLLSCALHIGNCFQRDETRASDHGGRGSDEAAAGQQSGRADGERADGTVNVSGQTSGVPRRPASVAEHVLLGGLLILDLLIGASASHEGNNNQKALPK